MYCKIDQDIILYRISHSATKVPGTDTVTKLRFKTDHMRVQ